MNLFIAIKVKFNAEPMVTEALIIKFKHLKPTDFR